ncbi:hypothetical protein DMA15_19705 [Streptomyces sp. WAC 01529]|uniref:hypothetical protein n=1 Tax=Streptomyces sp. WAC 01529 TaxID=2203205 RepID=UPI000F6FD8C2|nr:hypothetical protein [Streptomyces sp. WAC 01529]AZM54515.1 hypothetical protein DMA15_19705 [Streptomyces sp. WAC 01529]
MQRIVKAGLTAAVAAVSALAPMAATAAERPEVTLDGTARLGEDPSVATVSGTYTCRGVRGDAQLMVTLRTRRDRTPTASETQAMKQLFTGLGVSAAPVPKELSTVTAQTRTVALKCDGSATVRPWKRTFSGQWPKNGKAEADVTLTSVSLPGLKLTRHATASRAVTFV